MSLLSLYLLGCAIALGSATAAILRGETGVLGIWWAKPPIKWLIVEVLVAAACSWITVGFCQVQNAYRAAGAPGLSCGVERGK